MLTLKTLSNKKEFTKLNGDTVLDLVRRAISFLGIKTKSGQAFIVTEETAMRSDLISNHFYGSSNYCDLLLKYNGFSNPFSIDVGDILRVPDSDVLNAFGAERALPDIGKKRKKTANILFAPKTKKDQNRVKYLLKQAGATAPVPPNVALDTAVKLANGKIIFGRDVTSVRKQDCPDPISRTKLKETLIKNKLK